MITPMPDAPSLPSRGHHRTARCGWCQAFFVPVTWLGLDCWVCPTPACVARCSRYALSRTSRGPKGQAHTRGIFMPLPRQVDAFEAVLSFRHRWVLYGGARGGAKSHFLRWFAYTMCLQIPGFQCVLLRRTFPELEKTHMRRAHREADQLGASFIASANPPIVKFSNGSILEFGHCQDARAAEVYLSAEYHCILPDELGTFTEDMILKISSSARLVSDQFKPCVVSSTNPGSAWVRDRWISREVDRDRYPDYDPAEYCFIRSLLDDNPYPDPEYEAFLNAQAPEVKRAWRYGDWDVFEGQFFKEFRRDRHVRELTIPPDVPRICGLDWGYANPGVCLWGVMLPDGRLHIEREYKFVETVAMDVAAQIALMNRECPQASCVTYADPSMWIRSGQSGESLAETFALAGVPLQRAHHERLNGWNRVRHWLRPSPWGTPWVTFDPSCVYLIRTLPTLVHDETCPEDLDTTGADHPADALRYLMMSRPAPPIAVPEPLPLNTAGALFRQAQALASTSPVLGTDAVLSHR